MYFLRSKRAICHWNQNQIRWFFNRKGEKIGCFDQKYAANELRLSLRQNILLRHIPESSLRFFYTELDKLGFANPGYNTTVDITACPGTDTCNLGIASSTGIADVLEQTLLKEYPEYINNKKITIKISGCMNACGQHNMANIGFQGMSIRTPENWSHQQFRCFWEVGFLVTVRGVLLIK